MHFVNAICVYLVQYCIHMGVIFHSDIRLGLSVVSFICVFVLLLFVGAVFGNAGPLLFADFKGIYFHTI